MYYLFLDESGDHNLVKINRDYPVFVLAGCIFKASYYRSTFIKQIGDYKLDLFGTKKIILHTADITRNRNGFDNLKDPNFRDKFYDKTNDLINNIEFTLIACVVDKVKHLKKYKDLAFDPYDISLKCLLEEYYYFLHENNDQGKIYAESRGSYLDNKLELAYFDIKYSGIEYRSRKIRGADIRRRFLDFKFIEKAKNNPGLQIADLCATPVGRASIGKEIKEDYNVITAKFRRRNNEIYRYGLTIIPEECYPNK